MIIDLEKFIDVEREFWTELEGILDFLDAEPDYKMPLEGITRLHYLYQRASADLAKLMTFSAEQEIRRYLEQLVARAYAEIHTTGTDSRVRRRSPVITWFLLTFPTVFQTHHRAFVLSCFATAAGCVFGGMVLVLDPPSKAVLVPQQFGHLFQDPADRVKDEEASTSNPVRGHESSFSAHLIVNNTRVSFNVLALGMTFGIGSVIMLFYNGVILGLVAVDYVVSGQAVFLLGWLLPHGVIEIPAILIAGQASLVLASALIGWGDRMPMRQRLRTVAPALTTLIGGVTVMLVWAGLVEAFFSQYHEPVLPYAVKIAFGLTEFALLIWLLYRPVVRKARQEASDG